MISWLLTVVVAQPLSFDDALALAEQTPVLEAARRSLTRRRALAETVPSLTSNPSILVQPGARRLVTGGVGAEVYLGVTQDLNLAGFGAARQDAAKAEVSVDVAQVVVLLREVRRSAAEGWLSLWATQQALSAATEELRLASEWAGRVTRAATSGGVTRVDVAVANVYHAEAHLAALSLEGDAFMLGVALNRVLARASSEPTRASPTLPEIAVQPVAPQLLTTLDASPAVTLAAATIDAERARTQEAERSRGLGLQVGALGWREGAGDLAAVASLQVTLPLFERAQRERSAQEASEVRAEGRKVAAAADELATRVDTLHELEHSAEVLAVLEHELVPATEEAVSGMLRRFEAGEATAQELAVARRGLVAARSRLLRAQADVVLARFKLAELQRDAGRTR